MIPIEISIILFISCTLFTLFFIFKGYLSTVGLVFLVSMSSVLLDDNNIKTIVLLFLNVISLYICRIKAMKIALEFKAILNPLTLTFIFILTTLLTVIKNKTTFTLMDVLEAILLGATFSFFLVLLMICFYQVVYTLYLCNKYPSQSIVSLEVSNLSRNGGGPSLPLFFTDFKINKSVKITYINIDGLAYTKAKLGHKLNITKYKTDGKGNFLLF